MHLPRVLKIDISGLPISLVSLEDAAAMLVNDKVVWSFGSKAYNLHGGINNRGVRTTLSIPSIISVRDKSEVWNNYSDHKACRRLVYERDHGLCMYCSTPLKYKESQLDHIHPRSRGGSNYFSNLCLSCGPCNSWKKDRTPEEAGMQLLAVPYIPNPAAKIILSKRVVIADQMDYLKKYSNLRTQILKR